MRQLRHLLSVALPILGLLLLGSGQATAQTTSAEGHLAVGSWHITTDPADPLVSFVTTALGVDGTVVNIIGDGTATIGVWAPTGDTTADITITATTDGPAIAIIRASVEVSADGQTISGTYTSEYVFDPAGGGTSGEIGPGTLTGTRLTVQAPGTPSASYADFFALPSDSGDATPEATPVS